MKGAIIHKEMEERKWKKWNSRSVQTEDYDSLRFAFTALIRFPPRSAGFHSSRITLFVSSD